MPRGEAKTRGWAALCALLVAGCGSRSSLELFATVTDNGAGGKSSGGGGAGGSGGTIGSGGTPLSGCPGGTIDDDRNEATPCVPCAPGMFSDVEGFACYPWTECNWEFPEVAPPSSSSDRVCSGPQPFRQFGTDTTDAASQVVVDLFGNVYVAGVTLGSLDGPTNGNADAFLRKYSPQGELIWAYQGDPEHNDSPVELVLDDVGHLHLLLSQDEQTALWMFDLEGTRLSEQVYGAYYYDLAVDSQGVRYIARPILAPDGASDLELVRLGADGTATWTFGLSGGPNDWPSALTVAPNGDVVVCGYTDGSMFDVGSGRPEAFVARFTGDSYLVWGVQFAASLIQSGDALWTMPTGVVVDSADNIYVAGNVQFDEYSSNDLFITRMTGDGQYPQNYYFGSTDYDDAQTIAIDPYDRIAVVGTTWGLLTAAANPGVEEAFIARFQLADLSPVIQFGTTANDAAYDLAVAPDGTWFVVGSTEGSFVGSMNAGAADAYVLRVPPF